VAQRNKGAALAKLSVRENFPCAAPSTEVALHYVIGLGGRLRPRSRSPMDS
jgi:hypothetical protein